MPVSTTLPPESSVSGSEDCRSAQRTKDRVLDHRLVSISHGTHKAPESRRQRHRWLKCRDSDFAAGAPQAQIDCRDCPPSTHTTRRL
jgi:hypothetical protein